MHFLDAFIQSDFVQVQEQHLVSLFSWDQTHNLKVALLVAIYISWANAVVHVLIKTWSE